MATVIPNETNRALEQVGQNLLQAVMFSQQMNLRREQFDETKRATGVAETQAAQRIGLTEDAAALQRVLNFTPFITPGTTLAENPQLHQDFQRIFPDFDPGDPESVGGMQLNPETLDTALRPALVEFAKTLPEEDMNRLLEGGVTRAILGQPTTTQELQLGDRITGLRMESLDSIMGDPGAVEAIARTSLGLAQPVRLRLPDPSAEGGFREVSFDTPTAAGLAVDIWKFLNASEISTQEGTRTAQKDMVDRLIDQASQMDIVLGEPKARQIVGALLSDDPAGGLQALFDAHADDPNTQAVIRMFASSASIAESSYRTLLQQTPEGQSMLNFLDFAGDISDIVPAEERLDFIEEATEVLRNHVPMARYLSPKMFGFLRGGSNQLLLDPGVQNVDTLPGGTVAEPGTQPETPTYEFEGRSLTEEEVAQAALNAVMSGRITPEQIGANPQYGPRIQSLVEQAMGPEEGLTGPSLLHPEDQPSRTTPVQGRRRTEQNLTALADLPEGSSAFNQLRILAARIRAGTSTKTDVLRSQAMKIINRGQEAHEELTRLEEASEGTELNVHQQRRLEKLRKEISEGVAVAGTISHGGPGAPNQGRRVPQGNRTQQIEEARGLIEGLPEKEARRLLEQAGAPTDIIRELLGGN